MVSSIMFVQKVHNNVHKLREETLGRSAEEPIKGNNVVCGSRQSFFKAQTIDGRKLRNDCRKDKGMREVSRRAEESQSVPSARFYRNSLWAHHTARIHHFGALLRQLPVPPSQRLHVVRLRRS